MHSLPPEAAHALALRAIAVAPRLPLTIPDGLACTLAGLELPHPLGLAAGFDKDAAALPGLFNLGFAFVEAGTVTPQAQGGNPKPRIFRLESERGIVNRLGFNNSGLEPFARRLRARPANGIVGANIGINKDTRQPADDYARGATRLLPLADYLTLNVSSPNTAGLRDLQERTALAKLLAAVTAARRVHVEEGGAKRPVFLKVAPDLDNASADAIVDVAIAAGIDGLIVSNTTTSRDFDLVSNARDEIGGLSGPPLMAPSTRLLARMAGRAAGRLAFIGVGGVSNGADAYAKIVNGAQAVQLYTAFIYTGPAIIQRVLDELAACLAHDGHRDLQSAVGAAL